MKNDTEVLLVSAPSVIEQSFSQASSLYKPTEPLGLLYIAGGLRDNGISTSLMDCNGRGYPLDDAIEKIVAVAPRVIGISCLTQEAYMVEKLLRGVRPRLPDTVIVMGNTHSSHFHEFYLKKGIADVIGHGEGEDLMVELVQAIRAGGDLSGVAGISYLDSDGTIRRNPTVAIPDLDALPFPAWDMVNLEDYSHPFFYNFPKNTRTMITSRGCPIGCTFCTIHDGTKVRYQSPRRMVDEIKYFRDHMGTRSINFLDPMFLAKKSRVEEFCELLIEEKVDVEWACEGHVNYAKPGLFSLMKKAGAHTIFFGLESGDDQLLINIGKKTTAARGAEAIRMAHDAGLRSVAFFMLGIPGENEELTQKTIDFSLSLPLEMAVFSITSPYPGSQLFDDAIVPDDSFDEFDWHGFSNTGMLGQNAPVWTPDGYSYERLKKMQAHAMRKFHFRPHMIYRHLKTLRNASLDEAIGLFFAGILTLKG